MSNMHTKPHRPFIGRMVRIFSLPIIVFWVLVAVGLGILTPSLDAVAATRSVPISPTNSDSYRAMLHIGKVFQQYDSDSTAMVVLEGKDKLGDAAHKFYDKIVAKLEADHEHVQNVQDFWVIRSPRRALRAWTANPPTCRSSSMAPRARHPATSRWQRCVTSLRRYQRRRVSRPMSLAIPC